MSKRRRKKPNLPDDVLARARKQAGIEEPETEASDEGNEDNDSDDNVNNGNGETVSVNERAARRRKLSPVQLERSRKRGELDGDTIRDMLENPTVTVSEKQLREEYQHVLVDLRNMGILAAALMVLLVVLAQFI